MFSDQTRSLLVSRLMRKPIKAMQAKINQMLGLVSDPTWDDLKYMIYSVHDTQVDVVEFWLNPDDYEMDFVPFAANIFFELKFSNTCLQTTPSPDCFWVDIYYDRIPLTFSGFCTNSVRGCSWADFLVMMQAKWYNGLDADNLNLACGQ